MFCQAIVFILTKNSQVKQENDTASSNSDQHSQELLEIIFKKLEIDLAAVSPDEKAECLQLVSQAVEIVHCANIIAPKGLFIFAEQDKPFNSFKHNVMSGSTHEDADKTNAMVFATLFPSYAAEDDIANLYEQIIVDAYFPVTQNNNCTSIRSQGNTSYSSIENSGTTQGHAGATAPPSCCSVQ